MKKWFHRKNSLSWEWVDDDFVLEVLKHKDRFVAYATIKGITYTFYRKRKQASWSSAAAAQQAALKMVLKGKREVYS